MTMTTLEQAPAVPAPMQVDTWQMIRQQADMIANSGIVPQAYRGKPDDIVAAALVGQEHGWGLMTSLRYVIVIQGKPSYSAEALLAMILSRDHIVEAVQQTATVAEASYRRADNGATGTVSYTIQEARQAGLTGQNWKKYPGDMLWARCMSRLCRRAFPDVTLGSGYVPEELGSPVAFPSGPAVTVGDGWKAVDAKPVTALQVIDAFELLPEDAQAKIEGWVQSITNPDTGEAVLPSIMGLGDDDRGLIDQVWRVVDKARQATTEPFDTDDDVIVDAEVVE